VHQAPGIPHALRGEGSCTTRAHCAAGMRICVSSSSFRDGPKDQTSDAQLRIGESRDSGFDAEPVIGPAVGRTRWHLPGMTISKHLLSWLFENRIGSRERALPLPLVGEA
jgi:hypothetical protein